MFFSIFPYFREGCGSEQIHVGSQLTDKPLYRYGERFALGVNPGGSRKQPLTLPLHIEPDELKYVKNINFS